MIILPLLMLLSLLVPPASAVAVDWKEIAPGLATRLMDGSPICRRGSTAIRVLRIDPARWRLDIFHQSETGGRSLDIEVWARRTGASVTINAGQYYPDLTPMGLFIKQGRNLGTARIRPWKGLLVAEPTGDPNFPRTDIIDLEYEEFDPAASPWGIALQSFMIVDARGNRRVRRSDWHANRTVLAMDTDDSLLMIHTEGAYTLWELAGWLHTSDLGVRHAMSLDGGFEAQMAVHAGDLDYVSRGQWHVDARGDHSIRGLRRALPSVIGVFPR